MKKYTDEEWKALMDRLRARHGPFEPVENIYARLERETQTTVIWWVLGVLLVGAGVFALATLIHVL